MIRKARPSDSKQIAELCYIIWHDMELDIVQEITKERVIHAIEESIVNIIIERIIITFGYMSKTIMLRDAS